MARKPKSLLPPHLQNMPKPAPGSWLDVSSRRVVEMLAEQHGIVTPDGEGLTRLVAAELTRSREAVAKDMAVTEAEAEALITDRMLQPVVDWLASAVADEMAAGPDGAHPFADPVSVQIHVSVWSHAIMSLLMAADAVRESSDDYPWTLMHLATNMTAVVAGQNPSQFGALNVPRAGALYAARALTTAAEVVTEWDQGAGGISVSTLAAGIAADAAAVSEAAG